MTVYFKNAGHCTRCDEPFGGNATAYMVREDVAWTVLDDGLALTQPETVPVCDACVTEQELAKATIDATCAGCGQRMRLNIHWRKATCSNRCEQRERRKERRIKSVKCTVCKTYFETARTDKFCSGLVGNGPTGFAEALEQSALPSEGRHHHGSPPWLSPG